MINEKTTYSRPKRNVLLALNDLRNAQASGYKARLVREWNENCKFPIKVKNEHKNFRNYEFAIGYISTREEILADTSYNEFEKHLILNYKSCFGTPEAVKTYYETGVVSADNLKGQGVNHLVKISDMVKFLKDSGLAEAESTLMYERQYITLEEAKQRHFYDFFRLKRGFSQYGIKKFKHKLWVIELQGKEGEVKFSLSSKILNVLMYPFKFIPKKYVFKMDNYKIVTYRIGDVINGFGVEFHIPKKFGFK